MQLVSLGGQAFLVSIFFGWLHTYLKLTNNSTSCAPTALQPW